MGFILGHLDLLMKLGSKKEPSMSPSSSAQFRTNMHWNSTIALISYDCLIRSSITQLRKVPSASCPSDNGRNANRLVASVWKDRGTISPGSWRGIECWFVGLSVAESIFRKSRPIFRAVLDGRNAFTAAKFVYRKSILINPFSI